MVLTHIEISRYIKLMDYEKVFKAVSNPVRVKIMMWLREPNKNFPPMEHLPEDERGKGYICVSSIQKKLGITQSTVSLYLIEMKQADLLISKRIGQWTYYRRNEKTLKELSYFILNEL
jgi:ArsR family transcriptional regulator